MKYLPNGYNHSTFVDAVKISLTPSCAAPIFNSLTKNSLTSSSVTATFSDPDSTHTNWRVYYKKTSENNYYTSDITDRTFTLTDLDNSTEYEMYVKTICDGEESLDSTLIDTFTTVGIEVSTFPYSQTFEGTEPINELSFTGTGPNMWTIGTATNYNATDPTDTTTGHALYISNDNGVTNAYTMESTSKSYATLQVNFGDAGEYIFSFDYKVMGDPGYSSPYDYLSVYVVDPMIDNSTLITNTTDAVLYKETSVSSW